jgi:hypothetical protein
LVFNLEFLPQVELEGDVEGEGDDQQTFQGVDLYQIIGEVAGGEGDGIQDAFVDAIIELIELIEKRNFV